MTKVALVLLFTITGCANIRVNRAALIASTIALACDAGQTMRAARGGWSNQAEANPVMGDRPDQGLVAGYFAGTVIVNTMTWLVTPERYRAILPAAVVAVQADAIANNVRVGLGVCGL